MFRHFRVQLAAISVRGRVAGAERGRRVVDFELELDERHLGHDETIFDENHHLNDYKQPSTCQERLGSSMRAEKNTAERLVHGDIEQMHDRPSDSDWPRTGRRPGLC